MTRKSESPKVVDLGKASRETRGNGVGYPDGIGKQPLGGLSAD